MNEFSSDLFQFDKSETLYRHDKGKLVHYNNKVLAIGADSDDGDGAHVEELDEHKWALHTMSPVNGLSRLYGFTALTIASNLLLLG